MSPPLPPGVRAVSADVLYASTDLVTADPEMVAILRALAEASPRRRARLCAHPDPDAPQQEMLIVMSGDTYVRPHRHLRKSETLTVLEGEAEALIFDAEGGLEARIALAPFGQERPFFYRMPQGRFHGLAVRTPWFIFLETTSGPFDPAGSESAPWAPADDDRVAGRRFIQGLRS